MGWLGAPTSSGSLFIAVGLLLLFAPHVNAFGAGNIASVSTIEGKNWRHGDIEDMLGTIAFIAGRKWTSTMIKRVYFGNWLRDYSQAMDVGTLQKVQADTIRILVWVLSFMHFGYATGEFEVTAERLGVYRPEEHMDNPKDYADNEDARKYDQRLRGPVRDIELEIDMDTGMKNYIGNERGDWATSAGYVKYSFARSIHFGRLYTNGGHDKKGKEEDLCEALRCLGQGLHTLEDFGAHTNYCELVLREMGYGNVFPHTGVSTMMNVRGQHVFPLVTGTFGMVDFFHSVLGEATDHFTQSEIDEMDNTLGNAQAGSGSSSLQTTLTGLLGKVPGTRDLVAEADELKRQSDAQEQMNRQQGVPRGLHEEDGGHGSRGPESSNPNTNPSGLPGNMDPHKIITQIYPILIFRDKVVRRISSVVEKIPGLESLIEKISDTVTIFVFSLLAPYIRPLINVASKQLFSGSSGVVEASGKHQYEPWTNPNCTDPTHSLLSKDHFSNILNEPAGNVASEILKFVVPRILYAWQNTDVPVDHVLNDCVGSVLHHPALRDMNNEAHRTMFQAVEAWAHKKTQHGVDLNNVLSSESVKAGRNHIVGAELGAGHGHGHGHAHGHGHGHGLGHGHGPAAHTPQSGTHGSPGTSGQSHGQSHGSNIPGLSALAGLSSIAGLGGSGHHGGGGQSSHHQQGGVPWDKLSSLPIPGASNLNKLSHFIPSGSGGANREVSTDSSNPSTDPAANTYNGSDYDQSQTQQPYQYADPQQQQQGCTPGTEFGNIPPPTGYEQYHPQTQYQQPQGQAYQWPEYQPPAQGSHAYGYDYGHYQQEQQGAGYGYGYGQQY